MSLNLDADHGLRRRALPSTLEFVKAAARGLSASAALAALSACVTPATKFALAERRAEHTTIERCVSESPYGETGRDGCKILWWSTQGSGARWAAVRLQADASLSKNRPAFDEQVSRQSGVERQKCLARWLAREQESGPPQLDSQSATLGHPFCFAVSKFFAKGAYALFDEVDR